MEGWTSTQLKDLISFVIGGDWGKAIEYDDPNYVDVLCIRGTELRDWGLERGASAAPRRIKASSLEKRQLKEGNIILEVSGGGPEQPVGRVELIDRSAMSHHDGIPRICTNFFRKLEIVNGINAAYLTRFLKHFYATGEITKYQAGSNNLRNLTYSDYETIEVPIPPFNEQHRIVEKIETLFARLDKGEETLREVQKLLARYRQSVLKAAVTGQLTADWRAENAHRLEHGRDLLARILQTRRETWDGRGRYKEPATPDTTGLPELPKGWVWASLSQLTNIKGGVTVDKKREASDPVTLPYLRVANVQNGFLDLREIKEITVNRDKADQCLLQPGDILLNEGGDRDKLGRGWVWNGEISPCIHQNHVYRARPVLEEVSSKFISYYANAFGQPFFMQKGKQSVNLASISLSAISGLPIPLPSVEEQTEIVIAIEEKLAEIAIAAEACGSQLTRSAALRQSILKDAFVGRLVPQDPNDLPAPRPGKWFVYILECEDGSLYKGHSRDVLERWKQHATGRGAEWTAKHPPKRLVHWEELDSEEAAVAREKELKTGYGREWLEREIKAGRTRQAGEPASVLLARIRAERGERPTKRARRLVKP